MKLKSFDEYVKKRLTKKEISEIEQQTEDDVCLGGGVIDEAF